MTTCKENTGLKRPAKGAKSRKRFHFELGITQFFIYSFSVLVAMAWMFVFGLLVGRGLPLVESGDASMQAQVMRFLGLGREAPASVPNAAETWEDPKTIVRSLNYYESLTKAADPISGEPVVKASVPSPAPDKATAKPQTQPAKARSNELGSREEKKSLPLEVVEAEDDSDEAAKSDSVGERFTLLAASLKDANNAERFAGKLQAKGYSPRIEKVDMPGSGRWARVLVGSFDSREEALKFAAEFNRKENMQGLVVRLSP
jgi:cell division septation protein DedD